MPEATETAANEAAPAPEGPAATLVSVSIKRDPQRGPSLIIDSARFQEYLAKLGIVPVGGAYPNRPNYRVGGLVDAGTHKIAPLALLTRPNPVRVNLADYYSGTITFQQLTDLAYSVKEAANLIVEHYRPIEISIRLVEKK